MEPPLVLQISAAVHVLLYGASLYMAVFGKRLAWRLLPYLLVCFVLLPNSLLRGEFVASDALIIVAGGSLLTWLLIFCIRYEARQSSGKEWDGKTD